MITLQGDQSSDAIFLQPNEYSLFVEDAVFLYAILVNKSLTEDPSGGHVKNGSYFFKAAEFVQFDGKSCWYQLYSLVYWV